MKKRAAHSYPGVPVGVLYGMAFAPRITKEQELDALKGEAGYLKDHA